MHNICSLFLVLFSEMLLFSVVELHILAEFVPTLAF